VKSDLQPTVNTGLATSSRLLYMDAIREDTAMLQSGHIHDGGDDEMLDIDATISATHTVAEMPTSV